ncbi:hypothetical protein [Microbulbifer sp. 2205BS26-8]|uniref:hypothetical protein n=1 Tax=Microbulbifer sp. 2205BS26-8 TaxID=3064386 RepID=UPI0027401F5E|nr:hypothetical protein [Microbulbifer sp. 2205BS26-8]MDP5210101.1 hypothetical protein [Microbulbifer sp. 2205BS26-8]
MPILPCRLFQPVELGDYFTFTLVAIKENAVDLHIAPGRGNQVMRAVRFLQWLDEAYPLDKACALEEGPIEQPPAIIRPFKRQPDKKTER